MPKAYWIATYRSVSDPEARARYAELGGKAIAAGGGRILARGAPARSFEGKPEVRVVLIEFDSVAAAAAVYDSAEYRSALALLARELERDVRIVEVPAP